MNPPHYATYNAQAAPQQQFYGRTGSAAFSGAQFATAGTGMMPPPLHAWSPPSPQEHQYYDMLFAVADEEKRNAIGGRIAVAFFSRSGVDKAHLREIWTIADSQQRSELSRNEFYVAMRLIGMAQRGEQVSTHRFYELASAPFPLPTFEGIAPPPMPSPMMQPPGQPVPPPATPMGQPSGRYAITDEEKQRYDGIFQQYDTDHDGFLQGGEAVQLLGMSGLDRGVLRDIWALADRGQDSRLDRNEFYIAMHLIVCVSKRGLPLPTELPHEMNESVFGARGSRPSMSADPLASIATTQSRNSSMSIPGVPQAATPTTPSATMHPTTSPADTKHDPTDAFAGLTPGIESSQPSRVASFGRTSSTASSVGPSMMPPTSMQAPAPVPSPPAALDAAMSSLNLSEISSAPAGAMTGSFSGSSVGMGMNMNLHGFAHASQSSATAEPARERAGSSSSVSSFASVSTDASAAFGGTTHVLAVPPMAPAFNPMGGFHGLGAPMTPPVHTQVSVPAAKPFLSDETEAAAVTQLDQSNEELAQSLHDIEKKQHAIELLSEKLRELDQLRHELVTLSMKRDSLRSASAASSTLKQPRDNATDTQAMRAVEESLRELVDSEKSAIQMLQSDIAQYERELQQADVAPPPPSPVAEFGAFGATPSPIATLSSPSALPTSVTTASTPTNAFETFGGFGSSSPAPESREADAFANFNFS